MGRIHRPTLLKYMMSVLTQKPKTDSRFASITSARNIWAISAIHANIDRLTQLHDTLFPYIQAGDRLIYTGNYTGYGENSCAVIDEMLTYRRAVLAKSGIIPSDLIYLRGAQEEMWQKLLQLQFAPDPTKALLWMLGHGLDHTLYAYGLSPHDGIEACRQGMVSISKWTRRIREKLKRHPGHQTLALRLVRAAYTSKQGAYPMLFVNAGIDVEKSLQRQGDNFWWAHKKFNTMSKTYNPFQKVIRGYDPDHKGVELNCIKATIDGGCGFGGTLVATCFNSDDGALLETIEC